MRFPKSGTNDNELVASGSKVYSLLAGQGNNGITENRVFWLKGLSIYNSDGSADALVDIYDDADDAVGAAAKRRQAIVAPFGTTTIVDYPGPGIGPFTDNCCAGITGGEVLAYGAACWGYEVGGS